MSKTGAKGCRRHFLFFVLAVCSVDEAPECNAEA